jgi:uncharacterized membrane protein YgcG
LIQNRAAGVYYKKPVSINWKMVIPGSTCKRRLAMRVHWIRKLIPGFLIVCVLSACGGGSGSSSTSSSSGGSSSGGGQALVGVEPPAQVSVVNSN